LALRILLHGRLANGVGREVEVDVPDSCSVGELRRRLATLYPASAETLGRSRVCVASALVGDDHAVTRSEQVEFLPPVSGG
jgi:molybdopterin converting factor small subunit